MCLSENFIIIVGTFINSFNLEVSTEKRKET